MSKIPATAQIWARRERLEAMIERATEHEKATARDKLQRLNEKYDFSQPEADDFPDLFRNWIPKKSTTASAVFSVETPWMDVGNILKWIFENKFGLRAKWRMSATHSELMLEGCLGNLKRTKVFAQGVLETLQAACVTFFGNRTVKPLERAPFLSGLYDGLLNEVRPEGGMIPGYSPMPKKKAPRKTRLAKKSAQPPQAGFAVHPYDLGREAGRQMRLEVPREEICDGIRAALQDEPR
jgi:hypothetical protein